jgi:hypothetical protein
MKTSELTGRALDWAVAKCEGVELYSGPRDNNPAYKANWVRRKHGGLYQPSTDWAQGGPIIEREGISVDRMGGAWTADISDSVGGYIEHTESGPTPLIAAMRCYVASKLGDEVEIPRELT